MIQSTDSRDRLVYVRDKINTLCHYKSENKLLIIDQIEGLCSEEADRRELLSTISSVCSPDGHILNGW